MEEESRERVYTRRQWLTREAILNGGGWMQVREAVASVAIEHPEWDMDGETRTWSGWVLEEGGATM